MPNAKRYRELKMAGICTRCAHRGAEERRAVCGPCRRYLADRARLDREWLHEILSTMGFPVCVTPRCHRTEELEVDHIHGGGRFDRARSCGARAGSAFAMSMRGKYRRGEETRASLRARLQLLCHNCHVSKTHGFIQQVER